MKRSIIALVGLVVLLGGVPSYATPNMGGDAPGNPPSDPPLVVGADWYATISTPPAFFWGGSGWNDEGPFTFASALPVYLDVTDDFAKGDRFEIFDSGSSIGLTSLVATASAPEVGPEAAFNDPTYSSGRFTLATGAHSITILAVDNPWGGGRGYLRATVIPEPASGIVWSLLATLGITVGWWRQKRRAA